LPCFWLWFFCFDFGDLSPMVSCGGGGLENYSRRGSRAANRTSSGTVEKVMVVSLRP
jgi:hypothetical protein